MSGAYIPEFGYFHLKVFPEGIDVSHYLLCLSELYENYYELCQPTSRHNLEGLIKYHQGNKREARKAFEEALRLDSEDLNALENLAVLLDTMHCKTKAAEMRSKITTITQADTFAVTKSRVGQADALFLLAQVDTNPDHSNRASLVYKEVSDQAEIKGDVPKQAKWLYMRAKCLRQYLSDTHTSISVQLQKETYVEILETLKNILELNEGVTERRLQALSCSLLARCIGTCREYYGDNLQQYEEDVILGKYIVHPIRGHQEAVELQPDDVFLSVNYFRQLEFFREFAEADLQLSTLFSNNSLTELSRLSCAFRSHLFYAKYFKEYNYGLDKQTCDKKLLEVAREACEEEVKQNKTVKKVTYLARACHHLAIHDDRRRPDQDLMEQALQHFQNACSLQAHQKYPPTHFFHGDCLKSYCQLRPAAESFKRCLENNRPGSCLDLHNLLQCLSRLYYAHSEDVASEAAYWLDFACRRYRDYNKEEKLKKTLKKWSETQFETQMIFETQCCMMNMGYQDALEIIYRLVPQYRMRNMNPTEATLPSAPEAPRNRIGKEYDVLLLCGNNYKWWAIYSLLTRLEKLHQLRVNAPWRDYRNGYLTGPLYVFNQCACVVIVENEIESEPWWQNQKAFKKKEDMSEVTVKLNLDDTENETREFINWDELVDQIEQHCHINN